MNKWPGRCAGEQAHGCHPQWRCHARAFAWRVGPPPACARGPAQTAGASWLRPKRAHPGAPESVQASRSLPAFLAARQRASPKHRGPAL